MADKESGLSLSDLVKGKKAPSSVGLGAARAALGQGLMMGWGDEAEAWLREKMGDGSYEDQLKKIRGEYSQFSSENPFMSGAAEFAGAALPMAASLALPGAQAAAPAAATTGLRALAKMAAMGAAQGAVSGAGAATEGERAAGATSGALVGGAAGAVLPVAMRGAGAGAEWLKDRLIQSDASAGKRAAQVLTEAVSKAKLNPRDLQTKMAQDRAMGVPSMLLNVSPATANTARGVVKRAGAGADDLSEALSLQKMGSRERTQTQVQKALHPGDYFEDLAQLQTDLKTKADPFYKTAYSHGEVTDPEVLKFMELPQFQQGLKEAEGILAAEGRQVDLSKPTVEVLDQVKRGLDALIEKETDSVSGKTTSLGRVYKNKKNEFLTALDKAVPAYGKARNVYRGDAELMDAMRQGYTEFNKTPHEQVIRLVKSMGPSEKEAYRTGVARQLYGQIMGPAAERNAAKNLMSPEAQAKLQPLFDNPGQFNLFKAAMERESQLFQHSSRILGGSDTAENQMLIQQMEAGKPVGEFVSNAVTGGFGNALANTALRVMGKTQMGDKTAEKLANMLMAKDPHEVAAVVQLLEDHAAAQAPKAFKAGVAQGATVGGTVGALWPAPQGEPKPRDIEADVPAPTFTRDIDADLKAQGVEP